MEQLLNSLGISDIKTLLEGGALAAMVGIVSTSAIRWSRQQVQRGAWRKIRQSEIYRESIRLLESTWLYIIFVLFVALIDPVLIISVPLVLVLAALARRSPHRLLVFALLVVISAAIGHQVRPPYTGAAIVMVGILRYAIPIIWRKR